MSDNNSQQSDNTSQERDEDASNRTVETDGGVATGGRSADTDYLDAQVNIFKPSTLFMRDHLRIVWTMFAVWALFVFGPVTATYLATDFMTSTTVMGFPLHYFATAIGAPTGALVLSFVYARKRDQLDEKYGIDHSGARAGPDAEAAATDGGSDR
ncbi:DUF4212 domain-containing protein [Halorussus lipolyticus]|uniref:DUF4212 domain-containing protein n=1 Tax=Halorussus lipolyticus TaxID=3034024 RepID=UPI0023E79B19|nr:DUF4212 domain-containing protein [Halorussus sp. DT80]